MLTKLKRELSLIFSLLAVMAVSLTILGSGRGWIDANPLKLITEEIDAPVAGFTFSPDGECANVSVKFTNTSTGDDLTYEWDFDDGTSSTLKDPTHVFSSAVGNGNRNFSVKLTVTDKEGVFKNVIHSINVKEIPSLNVNSKQANTTFNNLQYFIVCD